MSSLERLVAERGQNYGSPKENHTRTARLWNAYLASRGRENVPPLGPTDVCFLNILQKVSRCLSGGKPTQDTLRDIAGYARNIEIILDYEDT